MNLKKVKLCLIVCKKGSSFAKLREITIGIVIILGIFLSFAALPFISYLFTTYTPFYMPLYKTDNTFEICDNNNIFNCIKMGLPYLFMILTYSLCIGIAYYTREHIQIRGFSIIIFILTLFFILIYYLKYFGFLLESNQYIVHEKHQVDDTNKRGEPCYFNQTINNYNKDCVDVIMSILLYFLMVIGSSMYLFITYVDCCKPCIKNIEKDVEDVRLELLKIEN